MNQPTLLLCAPTAGEPDVLSSNSKEIPPCDFAILVPADKSSEAGVLPSAELLAAMGKFNEELVKAGVMLAGEGLHPTYQRRAGSSSPARAAR